MTEQNSKRYLFEEAPIPAAVRTLAVPTVITQLINILYNYADTWFVGRTANAAMVASLGVSFPIYVIMAAIANLFGVGGSSIISRSLGEGNHDRARRTFTFCFWGGIFSAILYAVIMLAFRTPLIYAIGGDENSFPYIYRYVFWTMIIGSIPSIGNVLCGHLVRSIGWSKEAGFGMSMGGIINIILDPLFMFVILPEGREVEGAAIATLISNTVAFLYFLRLLHKAGKQVTIFDVNPGHFTLSDGIPKDVITIGFPAALQTTFAMLSNIFANTLIKPYGSSAVAGMGVAKKINMIGFNTCMGLTMGILPLLGYNYGAKNFKRMKETIRFTGTVVICFGLVCTGAFYIFAPSLVKFFIDEPESIAFGTAFLRGICFAAPMAAFSYLMNVVFQATGNKAKAFFMATLRKGFLDIPLMFLFSLGLGMGAQGVVLATPVAEILSVLLAAILYWNLVRQENL